MSVWKLPLAATALASVLGFATARAADPVVRDPLENYYGNTVVCAASKSGIDLCHVWFYRHGRMIIFDQGGAHPAHYTVGPIRPSGAVSVCQFWDDTDTVAPAELKQAMPPRFAPPPGADGKKPGRVCSNDNGRTTCKMYDDITVLPAEMQKLSAMTMGKRCHQGMCYPYDPTRKVGDTWVEYDDPAPNQGNSDKVFLLPGFR